MKKILFYVFAFALISQASAQKFGGGLEIGTMYSWLNTDSKHASAESGRLGFTYGAFLDMNLSENFAFSTGLNMNYTGGAIKYNENINLNWDNKTYDIAENSTVDYKIQYLELPISIKGKTQEIGYITYFARLGVNPSIAVKSRADIDGTVMDGTTTVTDLSDLNIKDNISLFNVGWHVGGGLEYSLGGTTSVIGELTYSHNFLSMTNDNITKPTGNTVNVTNSLITIKVGIKF